MPTPFPPRTTAPRLGSLVLHHDDVAGSWPSLPGAGLVLPFLSSLGIIFPNADLRDQIDLLLNFHPAAIRALWVDR